MLWRFRHSLFGSHFVAIEYGYSSYVRAVRFTPMGRPYVKMCGDFVWLDDRGEKWVALTFDKPPFLAELNRPHLRVVS